MTTVISSRPVSSITSVTCRTNGLPANSTKSLLFGPIRLDCPAAKTIPTSRSGWCGFVAMARGKGREAISINNPPAAISANSLQVMSTSARTSCNTQSSPFNFGERAHPGIPITGTLPILANINKLPGSTANPNWITCPPASITACGNSSCRSIIADPPQSKMMSAPLAMQF